MTPSQSRESVTEPVISSQQVLIDFLEAEVQLGRRFVELAANARGMGHAGHFEYAKRNAMKAAGTIRRFLATVHRTDPQHALYDDCAALELQISAL
jgi:hypothetical protein